ncbi:MAG: 16S rRNA (cytosine(967)-C(5))-methyltransferase RsmB [candidate division KSB1 bacterium]|nr:16S rRNA (cytosine(967)-C(5))-methyltransferase RsmB [candidate division KSB1 bacterium]
MRRSQDVADARELAIKLVAEAEKRKAYVDLLLASRLRNVADGRKRAFVTELVRGTVRWRRYLSWIAKKHYRGNYLSVPVDVKAAIEVGIYQLVFLSRVPDFAAVSSTVEIVKRRHGQAWADRTNAILRSVQRASHEALEPKSKDPVRKLAIRWSHPDWMVERWLRQFGKEETIALLRANNEPAPLTVRVNRTKINPDDLVEVLRTKGIDAERLPAHEHFVHLRELSVSLEELDEFREGYFTPQDPSAYLLVQLLNPRSEDTVFDVCAAPGGKATAIAEVIGPNGRVIASDLRPRRLNLVRKGSQRLGLRNIRLVAADARALPFRAAGTVLVDAPCSGTGVLRRRVDLRWQRQQDQVTELARLQLEILLAVADRQQAGDAIVYATCTLEREENEEVVANFLSARSQYVVDPAQKYVGAHYCTDAGYLRTYPHRHHLDGVFGARLVRIC